MKIKTIYQYLLLAGIIFSSCKEKKSEKGNDPQKVKEEEVDNPVATKSGTSGFTVETPEGWTRTDTAFMGYPAVVLMSEAEGSGDTFIENINIVTEKIRGASLAEYMKATDRNMPLMLKNYKEASRKDITVSGVPGKSINYSHSSSGLHIDVNAVFVVDGGNAYVITSSVEKGKMSKWQDEIDEVIGSFKLK